MTSLSELIAADPRLKPSNQHELGMIHMLSSDQKMFNFYKDPDLISRIKKIIPITELTNKCAQRMLNIQSSETNSPDDKPLESRDVFFLILLEWFKSDFFRWFDCGYCTPCKKPMELFGRRPANQEETAWFASNVEVYMCSDCSATENFPRYNHPMKLLETRRGRCGEWRNCFSAICVAFNYKIRLVHDFQDHVWNEIFLGSQNRWIHFDCCENAFDTPLMYEVGWGKKLIYCTGTSEYDCQDVTMRYTRDCFSVMDRRKGRCRPEWINRYLLYISSQLQRNCNPDLKTKLLDQRLAEIASLIFIPGMKKELKETEKQGRSSGSINWRAARGECSTSINQSGYIIKFDHKTDDGSHRFTYQPVLDVYLLDGVKLTGWSSATFYYENIGKKVERDWKMTYLCRLENSNCLDKGVLVYKFDAHFEWDYLTIKLDTKVYETGQVTAKLTSEPELVDLKLQLDDVNILTRSNLTKDVDHLVLTITLSGGSGDIGWQQAQIFRHSTIESENDFSMDIVFSR